MSDSGKGPSTLDSKCGQNVGSPSTFDFHRIEGLILHKPNSEDGVIGIVSIARDMDEWMTFLESDALLHPSPLGQTDSDLMFRMVVRLLGKTICSEDVLLPEYQNKILLATLKASKFLARVQRKLNEALLSTVAGVRAASKSRNFDTSNKGFIGDVQAFCAFVAKGWPEKARDTLRTGLVATAYGVVMATKSLDPSVAELEEPLQSLIVKMQPRDEQFNVCDNKMVSKISTTEDVVKITRQILKRLKKEDLAKLVEDFVNLPFEKNVERISKAVMLIFEKAVSEPLYSAECVQMILGACSVSPETSRHFRKQILDQCQMEFQTASTVETRINDGEICLEEAEEDIDDQLREELEDLKFQSRRRSLGNMQLIGELCKVKMLTPKIIVECVRTLLSSPDEENLECICKLLTTAGQALEKQLDEVSTAFALGRRKNGPPKDWMTKTLNCLKELSQRRDLSSSIRIALLDVLELRDNSWKKCM